MPPRDKPSSSSSCCTYGNALQKGADAQLPNWKLRKRERERERGRKKVGTGSGLDNGTKK